MFSSRIGNLERKLRSLGRRRAQRRKRRARRSIDHIALVGYTNAGKSTLMNLLGALDRPTDGQYFLDGDDVASLNDEDLSQIRGRKIGFVFQSFNLIPELTIGENVEVPLFYRGTPKIERHERSIKMLDRVGLGDRLGHRPSQLSGGQRQRVAIARATITEPRVLLADEPTGNLDHKSGGDVIAILEGLVDAGITLIMVTHDPAMGGRARRQLKMMDGRLASDETGGPDDTA